MKKKGATIVEIIVVIAIIFILGSCFLGAKSIKNIRNNIAVSSVKSDISNILTLGKQYSNSNKVRTRVLINREASFIKLIDGNRDISQINLPKGFQYTSSQIINISDKGVISSTTISFKDDFDEIYEITVAVGSDVITIY